MQRFHTKQPQRSKPIRLQDSWQANKELQSAGLKSAGSTGSETVLIATGTSSTAQLVRPSAWPVLPLACGLAVVPLALWKRRRVLVAMAALAMLVGGVSSCTSSGGGLIKPPPNSGNSITPAGTYSIPVTVSSGGLQHQVTLTLTVD